MRFMMLRENEKELRELAMLRYQADRYQAAGNGSMREKMHAEISRLLATIEEVSEAEKN